MIEFEITRNTRLRVVVVRTGRVCAWSVSHVIMKLERQQQIGKRLRPPPPTSSHLLASRLMLAADTSRDRCALATCINVAATADTSRPQGNTSQSPGTSGPQSVAHSAATAATSDTAPAYRRPRPPEAETDRKSSASERSAHARSDDVSDDVSAASSPRLRSATFDEV